jgi:UDP-glucose:(heptosyl)LPS alpha-1,3-glucosyltransferase
MRFAFCLFKYFPYGGLERNFLQMAEHCQKRGHDIDVYTRKWEGEIPQKLHVILVPYQGLTNHGYCKSFVNNLTKLLSDKHYDAVVGFNRMPGLDVYEAADDCYAYRVKQKHGFLYRLSKRYRVYSEFERAVFGLDAKTQIMLVTESSQTHFVQCYQTPKHRFHLLPPGIERNCFQASEMDQNRREIRNEYSVTDQQFLIFFIASNYKLKGLDRAFSAIAALPNPIRDRTVLWVIGRGKSFHYQRQARRVGFDRNVRFLGARTDVQLLLCGADLLIHPARHELGGMVLLEALVMGVPVLTTDVCGFASHVQQADAGLVVPSPFQQGIFNEALRKMLVSKEERDQWKKNALLYGQTQDLYRRFECAVDVIEQTALKNC